MELENIVLLLMATLIVIGYGYSLDMPQALEVPLRQQPYNLTSIDFNLLYVATALPIIFTDIPLGVILDKFPLQITVIIIAVTSFTAQLLTAVLFDFRPSGYLYMVYVLRAIVGVAGSSAFTMQGFVMARYGAEYFEMLVGFGLCVPYVVDAINVMVTPLIFDATNSISLPWYIASGVDFFAIIAALVVSRIVLRKQKRKKDQLAVHLANGGQEQSEQQQFKASYLLQMPKLFWLVNFTILGNEIVAGLYNNLNDLIVHRFQMDYVATGKLLLIPFTAGSLFSLIFGKMLSLKPQVRRFTNICSNILITLALLILFFLPNVPASTSPDAFHTAIVVLFLVFFSIFSGSIYTVLTSSVSLLADKKRLGTAWGVVGTAIGLGSTISPLVSGLIEDDNDLKGSYKTLTLVYAFIALIPLGLSCIISWGPFSIMDNTFDDIHNKPKKQLQSSSTIITITETEKNDND